MLALIEQKLRRMQHYLDHLRSNKCTRCNPCWVYVAVPRRLGRDPGAPLFLVADAAAAGAGSDDGDTLPDDRTFGESFELVVTSLVARRYMHFSLSCAARATSKTQARSNFHSIHRMPLRTYSRAAERCRQYYISLEIGTLSSTAAYNILLLLLLAINTFITATRLFFSLQQREIYILNKRIFTEAFEGVEKTKKISNERNLK